MRQHRTLHTHARGSRTCCSASAPRPPLAGASYNACKQPRRGGKGRVQHQAMSAGHHQAQTIASPTTLPHRLCACGAHRCRDFLAARGDSEAERPRDLSLLQDRDLRRLYLHTDARAAARWARRRRRRASGRRHFYSPPIRCKKLPCHAVELRSTMYMHHSPVPVSATTSAAGHCQDANRAVVES